MNKNEIATVSRLNEGTLKVDLETGNVFSSIIKKDRSYWKQLKPWIGKNGYAYLTIRWNNKSHGMLVHRVVWLSVYKNIPEDFVIDHINKIKLDNSFTNLRSCSESEHLTIHNKKFLTNEERIEIHNLYLTNKYTINEIADRYNTSSKNINEILNDEYYQNLLNDKDLINVIKSNTRIQSGIKRRGINNGNSKLTEEDILEIRNIYNTNHLSYRKIAELYSVTSQMIGYIIRRKFWNYI